MERLERLREAVRRRPQVVDAGAALLLAALLTWEVLTTDAGGPLPLLLVGGAAATVPLAWRRVYPLPAVAIVMAGSAAIGLAVADSDDVSQPPQTLLIAELLAVYSVAVHSERRNAVIGLVLSWARPDRE